MLLLTKSYNHIDKQKTFFKLSRGLRVVGRGGRGGFRDTPICAVLVSRTRCCHGKIKIVIIVLFMYYDIT